MADAAVDRSEQAFWNVLTARSVPAVQFQVRYAELQAQDERHYQVLEFLVVETLAYICPELKWTITPMHNDGGLDFQAESAAIAIEFRGQRHFLQIHALGQIKRAKNVDVNIVAGAVAKFRNLVDDKGCPATHLIFAYSTISTKFAGLKAETIRQSRRNFPGSQIQVIDITDLFPVWADRRNGILDRVLELFNLEQANLILHFVEDLAAVKMRSNIAVEIGPTSGDHSVHGAISLDVKIVVSSALPSRRIVVSFFLGPDLEALAPPGAGNPGHRFILPVEDDGRTWFTLRLRPARSGVLNLGSVSVGIIGGKETAASRWHEASLGQVTIEADRGLLRAPFQIGPNRDHSRILEAGVRAAFTGRLSIIALLGPGGIGKSRLVEELQGVQQTSDGDAERQPVLRSIPVIHDTQITGDRRFLRSILVGILLSEQSQLKERTASTQAALEDKLNRLARGMMVDLVDSVRALSDPAAQIDVERVSFVITVALIAALREQPVLLHLSNLHWADMTEVLTLSQVMERLDAIRPSLPHGLTMILEGRLNETLEHNKIIVGSTDSWRTLYESRYIDQKVQLTNWTQSDSVNLIYSIISREVGRLDRRDSSFQILTKHVLQHAAGNPLHIIEYLRYVLGTRSLTLAQGEIVDFHPPANVPEALYDLIRRRVEFITAETRHGEPEMLLKCLAEIGLRVDVNLFDAAAAAMDGKRSISLLNRWQIGQTPRAGHPYFEFAHETFRAAFLDLPWQAASGGPIRDALLGALSQSDDTHPAQIIAWARIKRLGDGADVGVTARRLHNALRAFSGDPRARIALARELLGLPAPALEKAEADRTAITLELARGLMEIGDWEEALENLNSLWLPETTADGAAATPEQLISRAEWCHTRGQILGDTHRMAEALEAIRDGLELLERVPPSHMSGAYWRIRRLLKNRLGVLHWFMGRVDLGVRHQAQAYRNSRETDSGGVSEVLHSCELGAVMMHRYPQRAAELLGRSVQLWKALEPNADPTTDYAFAQWSFARLLLSGSNQELKAIRDSLIDFHLSGRRSVYARALSAMGIGAANLALNELDGARRYFRAAVSASITCRNGRIHWKSRLALGMTAWITDPKDTEVAHAQYAGDLLVETFAGMPERFREAWGATLRLPLAHVLRLVEHRGVADLVTRIDAGRPPSWIHEWAKRPVAFSRSGEPFQIMHFRTGEMDVFLLG